MKYIIFFFALMLAACNMHMKNGYDDFGDDDAGNNCDYSNCNGIEPFNTDLYIKFTRNKENPNPKIFLMSGFYEDGVIIDSISTDTVSGKIAVFNVALNIQYTVFCKYKSGNAQITAIDGAFVQKKSYTVCDSVCWQIKNNFFNIKLKY